MGLTQEWSEGFTDGSGIKICLPIQETQVRSLDQEDPTCCGTARPGSRNYWAHACTATTEACAPRSCAPQQEKLPQWEARTPPWSAPHTHWPQLGKAHMQQQRPRIAKNKINNFFFKKEELKWVSVYRALTRCWHVSVREQSHAVAQGTLTRWVVEKRRSHHWEKDV